jgi:hypothetical protein
MKSLFCVGFVACLMVMSAHAELIEVLNWSFEYTDGGQERDIKTPEGQTQILDDWSGGESMVEGTGTSGAPGDIEDDYVCGVVYAVDSLYQLTDYTITEGDEYTLMFDAYWLWQGGTSVTFEGQLYYDDAGSRELIDSVEGSLADGPDWVWHTDYTLNTTILAGSPAIGKKLGVELATTAFGAGWFGFDTVRLLKSDPPRSSQTFYIDSAGGNDSNEGTSPAEAWASLTPVNNTIFIPGDRILFKAGTSYTGQLKPLGSGEDGNPIIIDMYGTGNKPAINGGGILDAVLLQNVEYYEVSNLKITNLGASRQDWRTGIKLLANNSGTLNHIHLKNLDVYDVNGSLDKDYEGCGIFIQSSGSTPSRFDDVLVEGCHVLRTDRNGICMRSGFTDRSGNWFPSLNVVIRGNLIEDCGGDCIKPWGADGCLVEYNVVDRGRQRCADYAAGIWPWSCDNTLIQFNEVSGMKGTSDGQGFDSDYNCQDTVFQYNYSHDNDGGFMLVCGPTPSSWNIGTLRTIIRYNISQNDGSSSRIFHISGGAVQDTYIYNNVIYVGSHLNNKMVKFDNWDGTPDGTHFYNNIFYVDGTVSYEMDDQTNTFFENNVFYGTHNSKPSDPYEITSNPLLVSAGSGGDGLDSVEGYKLQTGSPCITTGQTIADNGGRGFWCNLLDPAYDPDIGAHAYTHLPFTIDFNDDGRVDSVDVAIMYLNWQTIGCTCDLTGDISTNIFDLRVLAGKWLFSTD